MKEPSNPKWQIVPPNAIYAAIANVALGTQSSNHSPAAPAIVGNITLQNHQQDAVARVLVAIREFGGALLADSVGLGKTYVALAVAAEFKLVHVLAPANLLPMWRSAIAATHRINVSLHSLHTLSRRALANNNPVRDTLIIVDEAHHLRTLNTTRYRNAAQFMAGRSALLLSATPLHNRSRELQNILALFLGHRADSLDEQILSGCIVRRTAENVPTALMPAVHEHPPHPITDNPPVLESILTLPPPLPTQDGAAASALVRLGLLRAWCSSDAALHDTIRRRQMRGEALLHSLAHGRYPTQRELQTWIVGNDSIQLGFPELLVATSTDSSAILLTTLTKHLDALNSLLQLHTRTSVADPERASLLRALLHDDRPIIAFSQFASTVRALHRALSDVAGVASLTSQGGRVAGGPISRHELIAQFAPRAHSRPPPPEHERVRLLLTTDMLSEGVNLQDAGILVHLDLPWTDAARAQRVGRLARLGALHETIHVHTIAPPAGAERTVRIVETLRKKANLSSRIVGAAPASPFHLDHNAESAVECATRLRTKMHEWQHASPAENIGSLSGSTPLLAIINASHDAWIALIELNGREIVLASSAKNTEALSSSTTAVMHTIDCISELQNTHPLRKPSAFAIDAALADIARWHANLNVSELTGPAPSALSPSHGRALRMLTQRIATTPATTRNALAQSAEQIAQSISQLQGAGVEMQLEQWCQKSIGLNPGDWLKAFGSTVHSHTHSCNQVPPNRAHTDSLRVFALLILQSTKITTTSTPQSRAP